MVTIPSCITITNRGYVKTLKNETQVVINWNYPFELRKKKHLTQSTGPQWPLAAPLYSISSIISTICVPPFSSFQNRGMDLIKRLTHCPQKRSTPTLMCDNKSHCSSPSPSTDVASQDSGKACRWLTAPSLQGPSDKKGRKEEWGRERERGHPRPPSWTCSQTDEMKKKKKEQNKASKRQTPLRHRFSSMFRNTDPRRPVIGLVYNCQLGFYLPCRRFNSQPYVV